MTYLVAGAFVLAGFVLSGWQVLQARRAPVPPTRFQDIATSLPPRTRMVSNVAVALLLFTGVLVVVGDEPWWVRWPAFLALLAVTIGVQTLMLRRRRA